MFYSKNFVYFHYFCSCHIFRHKLWGSQWVCARRPCGWCDPPSSHKRPLWRPFHFQHPAVRQRQCLWKRTVSTLQRYVCASEILSLQLGWTLQFSPQMNFVMSSSHSEVLFLCRRPKKSVQAPSSASYCGCCTTCQASCTSQNPFLFWASSFSLQVSSSLIGFIFLKNKL